MKTSSQKSAKKGFSSFNLSPLSGGSLYNIFYLIWHHKVDIKFYPRLLLPILVSTISIPFRYWDRFYFWIKSKRTKKASSPPLFILGHWRSGTTHLHNLLCKAPNTSYVTTYQSVFPDLLTIKRIMKGLMMQMMSEKRPGDNVVMHVNKPQEDEFALSNLTTYNYYHFMYFPREYRYFYNNYIRFNTSSTIRDKWKSIYKRMVRKARLNLGNENIVLKNPANTGRVQLLLEMYPDAKFVFIYRNPITVFLSTRNFFLHLFPALKLQEISDDELENLILDVYENIMSDYLAQRNLIPENQLLEIRFEAFEKEPLKHLEDIYSTLKIPHFEQAKPAFKKYLDRKKSYKKNAYQISKATLERILERWDFAMNEWNYDLPHDIEIIDNKKIA